MYENTFYFVSKKPESLLKIVKHSKMDDKNEHVITQLVQGCKKILNIIDMERADGI